MQIRNVTLAILLAGTAFGIMAAPPTFTVKAPKWKKVAEATTEGVNIRKAPSTTAPRLVYNESKIDDYDTPLIWYGYWSATPPKGSVQPISFGGPDPVVSESNGWCEILNIGPKMQSNGWVNAKFVRTFVPKPMRFPEKQVSSNFTWLNAQGNTSDGVYGIYVIVDEMNGVADFYFGRLVDGVVVCPYTLRCDNVIMEEGRKCAITSDGSSYTFEYGPDVLTADYQIDLSKVRADFLLDVIEKAIPGPEQVVCNCNGYLTVFSN